MSTCFPPPYFARMFYLFVLCWGPWLVVYHCYAVISLLVYWCVWVGLPKHAIVTVWKETFIPRSASGQLASTFSPDSDIMAVETLLTLLWIRKIFSYKHTCTKKKSFPRPLPVGNKFTQVLWAEKRHGKTSQDTGKADYYVKSLTRQQHDRIQTWEPRSATVDRPYVFQQHFPL